MNPQVSIVIPLYNKEKHVLDTLYSVWSQSFSNYEVIVINDGSTDNSLEQLSHCNDKRLRVFTTKNKGVSHARNYGITKAKAELIAFLDADDIWLEHHLEDLIHLYKQFPDCGMYCKAYNKKDGNIIIKSKYKNISSHIPWKGIVTDYFDSSLFNSIAWTSAVMVPKSTLEKTGGFDTNITLGAGEDTDLWIRIALNYPVAFSSKVSAIHILHSENRISNSNTNVRQFIDLDRYNYEAETNMSLKKYLDANRYSIAIQYKLAKNSNKATQYIKKIDKRLLNNKQRFLLSQSPFVLRLFFRLKQILKQQGILLSSFR
ncbi:glycosyltransferase [uncultured Psychroserpens sp.]|uniref:glycosyltransferase family 2 protein n=1 Tax=uncultured Psychroserpens sp. TaxID=255436 RepID=UPI00260BBBDA|nr:glycosyltransferase [uncultured Psychroserpens sp.]